MEPMTLDLAPQAAEVARVVAGVRDDQLGGPTPCAGTPVAGLLDHLVGLTTAFRMAARNETMGGPATAPAAHLPPDCPPRLPAQLEQLAEAWRGPAAWDGMVEVAGVTVPADVMG